MRFFFFLFNFLIFHNLIALYLLVVIRRGNDVFFIFIIVFIGVTSSIISIFTTRTRTVCTRICVQRYNNMTPCSEEIRTNEIYSPYMACTWFHRNAIFVENSLGGKKMIRLFTYIFYFLNLNGLSSPMLLFFSRLAQFSEHLLISTDVEGSPSTCTRYYIIQCNLTRNRETNEKKRWKRRTENILYVYIAWQFSKNRRSAGRENTAVDKPIA